MAGSLESVPVRFLTSAVRLTWLTLAIFTPLVLLLIALVVIGVGSVELTGSTDAVRPVQLSPGEYQIERGDGRLADVVETTKFESEDGEVTFGATRVDIGIADDAVAIRAVAGMLMVVWLILAWVGVNSMSGIASSMRAGDGFTMGDVRRVRRLGIVVLVNPALTFLGKLFLGQMVDTLDLAGPPVSVDVGVADWWVWVLFGLLLVAIAELFAHGVALQELDEATI